MIIRMVITKTKTPIIFTKKKYVRIKKFLIINTYSLCENYDFIVKIGLQLNFRFGTTHSGPETPTVCAFNDTIKLFNNWFS